MLGSKGVVLKLRSSEWHITFSDQEHAARVADHVVWFMVERVIVRSTLTTPLGSTMIKYQWKQRQRRS